MKINNFEKKKMIPLTKEQWASYENANEHTWMIGRNSVKHITRERRFLQSPKQGRHS